MNRKDLINNLYIKLIANVDTRQALIKAQSTLTGELFWMKNTQVAQSEGEFQAILNIIKDLEALD